VRAVCRATRLLLRAVDVNCAVTQGGRARALAALGRSAGAGAMSACSSFCSGAVRPGSSDSRPCRRSWYLLPPAHAADVSASSEALRSGGRAGVADQASSRCPGAAARRPPGALR